MNHPKVPWLVFVSAGDRSNIYHWLKPHRRFDVMLVYYGQLEGRYKEDCDYYFERKGGKFPNLHYVYQNHPHLLQKYSAILVLDDDIIMRCQDIERLFEIRSYYDLWIVQPGFSGHGKISHPVTSVQPGSFFRYSNFIETTAPLFRTDKLIKFLNIFDPLLVGWGTDWWFMSQLGPENKTRYAISDNTFCLNPTNEIKGGIREINLLQSEEERLSNWQRIKEKYNLNEYQQKQFKKVRFAIPFRILSNLRKIHRKFFLKRS